MTQWTELPPELAEIQAQMDERDKRIETPDERPEDLDAWHELMGRYREVAGQLGICNIPGCLNPRQVEHPWCAKCQAAADEIADEIREWLSTEESS